MAVSGVERTSPQARIREEEQEELVDPPQVDPSIPQRVEDVYAEPALEPPGLPSLGQDPPALTWASARRAVYQAAFREALPALSGHLPPEDQAEVLAMAQAKAEEAAAHFDRVFSRVRRELGPLVRNLPPEDEAELVAMAAETAVWLSQTPQLAEAAFVNQFAGDPDGSNNNCGFASALMALRLLGGADPAPAASGGTGTYPLTMALRELGGGGTTDSPVGLVNQVVAALDAAGVEAEVFTNTWESDKAAAVEALKHAFLEPRDGPVAFVAAGNPSLGWPEQVAYDGGHFVAIAGYDPVSNTFTVLDPVADAPFQVTPEQLAGYLSDDNAEAGELVIVTPARPD